MATDKFEQPLFPTRSPVNDIKELARNQISRSALVRMIIRSIYPYSGRARSILLKNRWNYALITMISPDSNRLSFYCINEP